MACGKPVSVERGQCSPAQIKVDDIPVPRVLIGGLKSLTSPTMLTSFFGSTSSSRMDLIEVMDGGRARAGEDCRRLPSPVPGGEDAIVATVTVRPARWVCSSDWT